MANHMKDVRAQAETTFAKLQKIPQQGEEARVEHEAATLAARQKILRLRSLRLARDAANAETKAPVKKKLVTLGRSRRPSAASLQT